MKEVLRITATVRHVDKNESFYRVKYLTVWGKWKTILIARKSFYKTSEVVGILSEASADLPDDLKAANALIGQALKRKKKKILEITSRTGWHGNSFVYFGETFGPAADRLRHEGASGEFPELGLKAGTPRGFLDGLRDPCAASDYLLFAISVAASGPLLDVIGEDEGAMFHLHGTEPSENAESQRKTRSSSGKTLFCRVAASLIGRCRKSDMVTFAVTKRGLEDLCFAHNHLLAIFDEEGRTLSATSDHVVNRASLPYEVTSGRGKFLSKKATQDHSLRNLTWALPALSNGETPLDDPKSSTKRPEGAQVRMLPLPVPPGNRGGIFNLIQGSAEEVSRKSKKLARQVEDTIAANHGVVMSAYLRKLVPQRATLTPEVRKIIDEFVVQVGGDSDPWERRFAEKFGIVLAAAILLARFEVGPWTEERARLAVESMYRASRGASVSIEDATAAVLKRLRKLANDRTKFPRISKGAQVSATQKALALGVVREIDGHKNVLLISFGRFTRLVAPSAVTSKVLKTLARKQSLILGPDGKNTRQVMIKGYDSKKRRYVCLSGLVAKMIKAKARHK